MYRRYCGSVSRIEQKVVWYYPCPPAHSALIFAECMMRGPLLSVASFFCILMKLLYKFGREHGPSIIWRPDMPTYVAPIQRAPWDKITLDWSLLSVSHASQELKSLAWKFLVICGSLTVMPSRSLVILIWQPRRLVSVRPKARSSMSFSSSSASGMRSKYLSSVTITWQVEHAQDPPQAPG